MKIAGNTASDPENFAPYEYTKKTAQVHATQACRLFPLLWATETFLSFVGRTAAIFHPFPVADDDATLSATHLEPWEHTSRRSRQPTSRARPVEHQIPHLDGKVTRVHILSKGCVRRRKTSAFLRTAASSAASEICWVVNYKKPWQIV
jgi:hypothetical protein